MTIETSEGIYFYGGEHGQKYAAFSNFFPVKIKDPDSNLKFNCSEQYFMYYKCLTFEPNNTYLLNTIWEETNPKEIKKLGRLVKNYDERIWNAKRMDVMRSAVRLKFSQHQELIDLLLSTGDKQIYEASRTDNVWGIGYDANTAVHESPDRYGMNLLGVVLMETREWLRRQQNA